MRYSASEKFEIIELVEQSSLSIRRTLAPIGIPRSTFLNGGLGHKAALRVREVDGELTRRQVGSSRARLTIAVPILSGILFQIRRGLGLPSSRASIPPPW